MRLLLALCVLFFCLPAAAISFADMEHVTLGPEVTDSLFVSGKAHVRIDGATILGLTIEDMGKVWLESGSIEGRIEIEDKGKLFLPFGFDVSSLDLSLDDKGKVLVATAIPEPYPILLMGMGLVGIALGSRRPC